MSATFKPLSNNRSSSFSDTDLIALEKWTDEERKNLCLTIWVDASILRIALCPTKDAKKAIYLPAVPVNKATNFHESYMSLRNSFAKYRCVVVFSTISFAGPLSQDNVVITNWTCEVQERVIHFASLPFDLFPLDRRMFMNDLQAASYGILSKYISKTINEIFVPLWKSDSKEVDNIQLDGNSAVCWIGDGVGISYICRNESSEHNCVVSSECSHAQCTLCSPNDPLYQTEYELIKFVSHKVYAGSHDPEWEDLGCIRGGEMIYRFLKQRQGIKLTEWPKYNRIREMALQNEDPDALLAFKLHYRFIIRAMQSFSLGIQCQRMFLISEHHVKNMDVIEKFVHELHDNFIDHPRSEWLKKVNIYAQCKSSSFALSGGLFLARIFASSHLDDDDSF